MICADMIGKCPGKGIDDMLISIVMPVYNNETYFPLAVKSITQQDYSEWELIIVDDGSTDQTPALADEIARQDRRITVIHQENQWIYASFNRGIDAAKGDYIYILNSDDRIRPGSLRKMAEKAKEYCPDVVWTKVLIHRCDEQQKILSYNIGGTDELVQDDEFYPDRETVRAHWPKLVFTFLARNQANLYRAELMKRNKFRTDVYGADTLFNVTIAPQVSSAFVMKEPVYDFFIYEQSQMNASVGKFYPYEHDMFNEIYSRYMTLFSSWKIPEAYYKKRFVGDRIKQVSYEIRTLSCADCKLSTEEKLEHILCKIPDGILLQCAELDHREEELESRILSGIRGLLVREAIEEDSKMYFAFELLESLLCYEKDEEDFRRIEAAIMHPCNPAHIGQTFYNKLRRMYNNR